MSWNICFILSVAIFILAIVISIVKLSIRGKKVLLKPFYIFAVSVAISTMLIFYPVYFGYFEGTINLFFRVVKSILFSIYSTIGLFLADSNFELIETMVSSANLSVLLTQSYTIFASILFVVVPISTFGIILSFFKNVISYVRYWCSFAKPIYIFSYLNDYSVTLAEDIFRNHKNSSIVFTDVYNKEEKERQELIDRIEAIGAICFKKDISSIKFGFHLKGKKSKMYFFVLNEKEEENIKIFSHLSDTYRNRSNAIIYLFSKTSQGELVISSSENRKLQVRKINYAQSLVYRTFFERGEEIFANAKLDENGQKIISAVVIGLGNYGSILTKTLAWYCQMDGYKIKINAFDKENQAKSNFISSCSELMSEKYNGKLITGEPHYDIQIHAGIQYDSKEFDDELKKIKDATVVFVCCGSDGTNIDCAVKVRKIFEGEKMQPTINTIVYDSKQKSRIESAKNFKNQPYNINCIGDIKTTYSEKVIINSELEKEALARHLKYGSEEDFWKYDYNYRSSLATALHMRARIFCGIPGANKQQDEATEQEKEIISLLEHKRWNAYMRTEGYSFGERRNDLAKQHHNLVPFSELTAGDIIKDTKVGLK